MSGRIRARLAELGLELPEPSAPPATFIPVTQSGNLLFVAGHGPRRPNDPDCNGKLGRDLTVEQGQKAARYTILAALSSVEAHIGDLDRVTKFLKLLGMVNSAPDFYDQPKVINGASDLLVQVFGPKIAMHARSAVGMAALPSNIAVEIEMVVEVDGAAR
jgi:enamine deaminase RidA (YjgF/YER057c/UK114 family)